MPIIQSCCCWRSLRRGCYASAIYTMVYFSVTIVTMGHFIEMEQRYLSGDMTEPESESFLEPEKITPITVSLNITLLVCSTIGLVACVLLIFGVHKDVKYMLLPWVVAMAMETLVEIINLFYLFYLQTLNFNPITSFLFTLDFFIIVVNIYAMICVISQFQEYLDGRGTAAFENVDRNTVQYTATAQQTTTTSSAPSGRRRSAGRPMPSRCDPEEFSEAPTKVISRGAKEVKVPRYRTQEYGIPVAANVTPATRPTPRGQGSGIPVPGRQRDRPAARTVVTRAEVTGIQSGRREESPVRAAKTVVTRAQASGILQARVLPPVKEWTRGRGRGLMSARTVEDVKASGARAKDTWAQPGRGIPAIRVSSSQAEDNEIQVSEPASVLSRPSRSAIKKHVQFPDEQSCIEEAIEAPSQPGPAEKPDARVISSLWMELESEVPAPER